MVERSRAKRSATSPSTQSTASRPKPESSSVKASNGKQGDAQAASVQAKARPQAFVKKIAHEPLGVVASSRRPAIDAPLAKPASKNASTPERKATIARAAVSRPAAKKPDVKKAAASKAPKPEAKDDKKAPKTKKTTTPKTLDSKASTPTKKTAGNKPESPAEKQAGKGAIKSAKPTLPAGGTTVAPQAGAPRVAPEKAPKKTAAPKTAPKQAAVARQPDAAAKPATPKAAEAVSSAGAAPKAPSAPTKATPLKPAAPKAMAPKAVAPKPAKLQAAKSPNAAVASASASAAPARASARKDAPHGAVGASRDPESTGRSRVVLMARDPKWLCAYWELDPEDVDRHRIGALVGAPLLLVRLSHDDDPAQDFTVLGEARTWYIPTQDARGAFQAALGYIGQSGAFVRVAISNRLDLAPPIEPAAAGLAASRGDGIAGEPAGWAVQVMEGGPSRASAAAATRASDAPLFERPDRHAGGASEQQPPRAEARALGGASEALLFVETPGGASEAAGPDLARLLKLAERGRGFWLLVATELIVYGATEPDARVTIAGEPVALRPDGTFTVRYALPDGRLEIPVQAAGANGAETRAITPIVEKQTI